MQFFTSQGINPNTCQLNTTIGNWYIDIRINGVQIAQEQFYTSIGTVDSPTTQDWITGIKNTFSNLLNSGYSYNIDEDIDQLVVFNNNCIPNFDDFELNLGINFEVFCNA